MNQHLNTFRRFLGRQPKWVLAASFTGICLLVGGSVYLVYAYKRQTSQAVLTPVAQQISTPTPSPSATPTPATTPSLLNGQLVSNGSENLHPLAVMIENHPEARPQFGLGSAGEVVEAISEGGITRFMAIYTAPAQPIRVGPIRSARPYFISFAQEVQAIYAHAGGSKDALDILSRYPYNLDGLSIGSPAFIRDFSRKVSLEHTLFSSTDTLWGLATSANHWPSTVQYPSLLFADDSATSSRPATQAISVSVSDPLYAVTWTYEPSQNRYLRGQAGSAHVDQGTGQQIAAKTVVLQTVGRVPYTENYSGGVSKTVYNDDLVSGGKAVVIENGKTTAGSWKISNGRTRYYDAAGAEIALVRGTLWIHLVHDDSAVSY